MLQLIKKNWIIILIVLVAAFTRLYRIYDYAEFLGDQGRDVYIVRDFLKNGNLFFIGPQTSVGNMYLGPFYYYLFVAPGLLLSWFNPVGPAIIVALVGVVTAYLIYKLSSEWFSPKVGIIAALLYSLSPTAIKYSSFSWNPNVMPLFSLLFVYFLTKKHYVLATLAFIICLNSHFLALILLPLALYILFLNYPISIKTCLVCIGIFLFSLTPQFLFDLKHNGQNINALITFFTQRETTVNLKAYKAIPGVFPLFNQINSSLLASKTDTVALLTSSTFLILIVFALYRQFKLKKFNKNFLILSAWYLSGLIGLGLYKQHIYDHYFGFLYPAVFILFAYLLTHFPKILSSLIVISLATVMISNNPFRYSPPRQIDTTSKIVESIINESEQKPLNFALLAKMNYDPGYRYFLAEKKAPVELLQNKITEQLFVVCEPFQMNCNPINNPEWAIAAFGWAKIDKEWEINGIKVYRLLHTQN